MGISQTQINAVAPNLASHADAVSRQAQDRGPKSEGSIRTESEKTENDNLRIRVQNILRTYDNALVVVENA